VLRPSATRPLPALTAMADIATTRVLVTHQLHRGRGRRHHLRHHRARVLAPGVNPDRYLRRSATGSERRYRRRFRPLTTPEAAQTLRRQDHWPRTLACTRWIRTACT